MALKSNFKNDLKKEQQLALLLDTCYKENLKHYTFERVLNMKNQIAGVDVIFTNKASKQAFYIDEKAQLDYLNEDLPTFAFEINYHKNNKKKEGWLFDTSKKTDFYALITGIFSDEPGLFTSCKITLVNRLKLLQFLKTKQLTLAILESYSINTVHGKIPMKELDQKSEGYLYSSQQNKAEKPLNLILRLEFLLQNHIAKRLI